MTYEVHGELQPAGGGDPIPLIREVLTIGRRESCDICLRYPNISGIHAQL
jgi:adenylate cyclase